MTIVVMHAYAKVSCAPAQINNAVPRYVLCHAHNCLILIIDQLYLILIFDINISIKNLQIYFTEAYMGAGSNIFHRRTCGKSVKD